MQIGPAIDKTHVFTPEALAEPLDKLALVFDEPIDFSDFEEQGEWHVLASKFDDRDDHEMHPAIKLQGFVFEPVNALDGGDCSLFDLYDCHTQESYEVMEALFDYRRGILKRGAYKIHWGEPPVHDFEQNLEMQVHRHLHLMDVDCATGFESMDDLKVVFSRLIGHETEGTLITAEPNAFEFQLPPGVSEAKRAKHVAKLMSWLGFRKHRGYYIFAWNDHDALYRRHCLLKQDGDRVDFSKRGQF